ncbi:MAG: polysaccharide deacetylase family protein [Bdellovibrionales bacterium]|nr:polysaccharide deacetylase family protein [Bdellovibrionales bacterium]
MAASKIFALRFDIDTPKCLSEGVPPLIDLAERLGMQFTFFLNVGRSVSLGNFVKNKLSGARFPSPHEERVVALSARAKLGLRDYLYTALINPNIGPSYPKIVERLAKSQELGLHGGRNHDLWHHGVSTWSVQKLENEIEWSLSWLRRMGVQPAGFSAPGWAEHPDLPRVLERQGFRYRADRHGSEAIWGQREGGLINVGTNMTGEPGGVAYFEHQRALGKTTSQVLADFEQRLQRSPGYAVVYDHPYYAGLREIDTLEAVLRHVRECGYRIVTLAEVAELCRTKAA